MIQHVNECVEKNESFAFETTLSGKGYINKIKEWKEKQYEIIIYFLQVPSVEFAIERVKLLTERYNKKIQGVIACYDRVVIHGTLPGFNYAVDNRDSDCLLFFAWPSPWQSP